MKGKKKERKKETEGKKERETVRRKKVKNGRTTKKEMLDCIVLDTIAQWVSMFNLTLIEVARLDIIL